jgi:hypothetical protein
MYRILFCLLAIAFPGAVTAAEVELLGQVEIPAAMADRSGEQGTLEGGIPANQWGGFGSGIAWLGGGRYAVISDRGPADGKTAYRCRYHVIDIAVHPKATPAVQVQLLETHLLSNPNCVPLIGSLKALPDSGDPRGLRFDPEAIRATPRGTIIISEEYGPSILEFAANGRQVGQWPVPGHFLPGHSSADPNEELPPRNSLGRQPNRGLECLAVAPDGNTVYALLQSPLIQDGALDAMNKRVGTNVRLLEVQRGSGAMREFLYQLDNPANGCNEIEYLAPGRFLVIERDSKLGNEAGFKKIVEIDLRGATDIHAIESLPSTGTPDGVVPVTKRPFVDLLDARWKLAGESFPEKIEGIALGPKSRSGSRILVVTSDNDFLPLPSRFYVFEVR